MDALRVIINGFSGAEKQAISTDPEAMAKGRTHLGDLYYMSLLAAVDTNVKKTDKVDESKKIKHHLTGAEADSSSATNIEDYPHLKPFVQAAVGAGKRARATSPASRRRTGRSSTASSSPRLRGGAEVRPTRTRRPRTRTVRRSCTPTAAPRAPRSTRHAPLRTGRRPGHVRLRLQRGHHRVLHAHPHRPECRSRPRTVGRSGPTTQARSRSSAACSPDPGRVEDRPGDRARPDLLRGQARAARDQVQGRAPGEDQHDDGGGAGGRPGRRSRATSRRANGPRPRAKLPARDPDPRRPHDRHRRGTRPHPARSWACPTTPPSATRTRSRRPRTSARPTRSGWTGRTRQAHVSVYLFAGYAEAARRRSGSGATPRRRT